MADAKARSKLLNKHKQETNELEKKLKKAKGMMKDKAQDELDAALERHEQELKDLEAGGGDDEASGSKGGEAAGKSGGGGKKSKKDKKSKGKKKGSDSDDDDDILATAARELNNRIFGASKNWSGLSKKELEECCIERGLGKKGSKEDLTMKLITYHQTQDRKLEEIDGLEDYLKRLMKRRGGDSDSDDDSGSDSDAGPAASSSESDDSSDDSDSDSDEEFKKAEVSAEEAEKQFKREKLVRGAVVKALERFPRATDDSGSKGGFLVAELPDVLASNAQPVKGFKPEICGYSSLEKFAKAQRGPLKKYMKLKLKADGGARMYPRA